MTTPESWRRRPPLNYVISFPPPGTARNAPDTSCSNALSYHKSVSYSTMSYQPNYSDPYSTHQAPHDQSHSQYPSQSHPSYPTPDYSSDSNPYDDAPRYPTYAGDPSGLDYGADQSTEKIVNSEGYGGTERSQPGRSGLNGPMKSFAEMGPPPRSTGILHMWRKDERGQQWFRVGL
jgi:hypothetical protein